MARCEVRGTLFDWGWCEACAVLGFEPAATVKAEVEWAEAIIEAIGDDDD